MAGARRRSSALPLLLLLGLVARGLVERPFATSSALQLRPTRLAGAAAGGSVLRPRAASSSSSDASSVPRRFGEDSGNQPAGKRAEADEDEDSGGLAAVVSCLLVGGIAAFGMYDIKVSGALLVLLGVVAGNGGYFVTNPDTLPSLWRKLQGKEKWDE
eukprot:CAMPEP_0204133826 /NCGR_PEP_ID=MMETSP0361-20130328/15319_1 /ASSEMBLY_ACC=CAM_ASM_000343 /TAXON_ID=268821 /ORGANISM="Scrippsiella Hangoei, Strain SHTV-5" /LENGTH=157 /DNA_ID=CAMNT_0051086935 /DNA_START=36 /DNA_END=509 /DNA_ORIENTATION=-